MTYGCFGGLGEAAREAVRPLRVKGWDEVEGLLDLVEDCLSCGDGLAAARPVGVASHSRPLRARRTREHPAQAVDEALGGLEG